jgi:LmbE family N-acetylglucosaminyl deacetylase
MKKMIEFVLFGTFMTSLAFLFACQREQVEQYAAIEVYPEDSILNSIENKRAMIVVAHDDDMCASSGTIALLNKRGWEIAVISMTKGNERNEAQRKACRPILDEVFFADLTPMQLWKDYAAVEKPYQAFPKDQFDQMFNRETLEEAYLKYINKFKPTVIFTLDNDLGGYGHPEHVLVSQMVLDLARAGKINPAYVYQSVYTNHMEETIMARHAARMKSWGFPGDGWEKAKQAYQVEGMPEPNVQINIQEVAQEKMNYLRSYLDKERSKINFFIPAFEDYSADEYFRIFNREFFRLIRL